MARRSRRENPEALRQRLILLLQDFEQKLSDGDLREQVQSLVPANHTLRDLGSSLISDEEAGSARDRILAYFRKYPAMLLHGDELMVVAGISEYARRIRELRVQIGWPILSGQAVMDMLDGGENIESLASIAELKTDSYILLDDKQDRDSAYRWNIANDIRKSSLSVKDKILTYLRKNVGHRVTGEELKYLAKDRSEWPRRARELRTEDGWPVMTRNTGMPQLPVGVYVLEEDRQAPAHDRTIPDPVRVSVLERDNYTCRVCQWTPTQIRDGDRIRTLLELHHIEHHSAGGENIVENLIALCNVCHDEVHRGGISEDELKRLIGIG